MKKKLIWIGGVLALLVVVALAIAFFSLNSLVVRGVNSYGPGIVGVDVRLDAAALSPFSGSGSLMKLFVGNPEGYKTASAIKVGRIKAGVQIGSVMSDRIIVNEVDIQAPEITLEVGLNGKNNLSAILNKLNPSGAPAATPAKTSGSSKKITVKDLVIAGGSITVSSPLLAGQSLTVPLPPLHLQNIGSDGGVTIGEFVTQVMKPLLESSLDAGLKSLANVPGQLKDLGKGGVDQFNKTANGLGNLFKK